MLNLTLVVEIFNQEKALMDRCNNDLEILGVLYVFSSTQIE